MKLDLLANVFRTKRPLNQAGLRQNRSRLHIGMSDVKSGEGVYMNMRDMPSDFDIVNAIIASSSIPGFTQTVIEIRSKLLI